MRQDAVYDSICHDTGILNIWLKIVTVGLLEQRWEGLEVRHVEHGAVHTEAGVLRLTR